MGFPHFLLQKKIDLFPENIMEDSLASSGWSLGPEFNLNEIKTLDRSYSSALSLRCPIIGQHYNYLPISISLVINELWKYRIISDKKDRSFNIF
jgi:hypothetical protein